MAEKTCFIRGLVFGPHVSITSCVKFGSYLCGTEPMAAVLKRFDVCYEMGVRLIIPEEALTSVTEQKKLWVFKIVEGLHMRRGKDDNAGYER